MSPSAKKGLIRVWDVMYIAVIALTAYSFHAKPPETSTGTRNRIVLIAMGVVGLILNRVAGAMTRRHEQLWDQAAMDRIKQEMGNQLDQPK